MADIVVTEFLDPEPLEKLRAAYTVHIDTDLWNQPSALEVAVAGAIALIVRNRTQVTAALLAKAPNLRAVGRLGVGLDNIDVAACKLRRIAVCPAIGANAVSVAEYVIGSAILLGRIQAFQGSHTLLAAQWPREAAGAGREIAGQQLGIIGFGNIGQTVAARARAMGMRTTAFDDYVPPNNPAWADTDRQPLNELLATSDIISLHCPLTPETKHLLNAARLQGMKKGALLINAARGGVVDETALAAVLRSGHLGGAAVDVFDQEPMNATTANTFKDVPNLILTPHVAGVTRDSNARISSVTVANVLAALETQP